MKKKTKITLIFLIFIGLICSMFVIAIQLKIIEFGSPLFSIQTTEKEAEEETSIKNTPPIAHFTYSNDEYIVQFHEQSTDKENDVLTYVWDFGDETTSTDQNPIHTYDCSETNVFDITLTVNDGEYNDVFTEHILFGSHLDIIDYSQIWMGYDSWEEKYIYEPVWFGDISMTVENTGNIPAEIYYAKIKSKEKENGYSSFSGKIYFDFTYTYEEVFEYNENGFMEEIIITVISNNTKTILPGESIVLRSNLELTYVTWGVGTYPVNIWLFEKIRGEDISYTLYETVIELT